MLEIMITPNGMKNLIKENINKESVHYCLYIHLITGLTNSCRYCPMHNTCRRRLHGVLK